jgi:ElaB/YqjD/DUF883 family membrane-anchored ribosome-binding protein
METMPTGNASTETGNGKSFTAAALGLAATALDWGEKAVRARLAVDHAVEDGLRAAHEAVRKGRYATEDFLDQTTLRIRQEPLQSVGCAFASGVLLGGTMLYAIGRLRRRS